MYLKITGIVLIMMSASLMGYLFSKDYIERINRLEQIQKMLILLKGEISYSNNSDSGSFGKYIGNDRGEGGGVCDKSSGKF